MAASFTRCLCRFRTQALMKSNVNVNRANSNSNSNHHHRNVLISQTIITTPNHFPSLRSTFHTSSILQANQVDTNDDDEIDASPAAKRKNDDETNEFDLASLSGEPERDMFVFDDEKGTPTYKYELGPDDLKWDDIQTRIQPAKPNYPQPRYGFTPYNEFAMKDDRGISAKVKIVEDKNLEINRKIFKAQLRDTRIKYKAEVDQARQFRRSNLYQEWIVTKQKRAISQMERRERKRLTRENERAKFRQFLIQREEKRALTRAKRIQEDFSKRKEEVFQANYMLREARENWILNPEQDVSPDIFTRQLAPIALPGFYPRASIDLSTQVSDLQLGHKLLDYENTRNILQQKQQIIQPFKQTIDQQRDSTTRSTSSNENSSSSDYKSTKTKSNRDGNIAPLPSEYGIEARYNVVTGSDIRKYNLSSEASRRVDEYLADQSGDWKTFIAKAAQDKLSKPKSFKTHDLTGKILNWDVPSVNQSTKIEAIKKTLGFDLKLTNNPVAEAVNIIPTRQELTRDRKQNDQAWQQQNKQEQKESQALKQAQQIVKQEETFQRCNNP